MYSVLHLFKQGAKYQYKDVLFADEAYAEIAKKQAEIAELVAEFEFVLARMMKLLPSQETSPLRLSLFAWMKACMSAKNRLVNTFSGMKSNP